MMWKKDTANEVSVKRRQKRQDDGGRGRSVGGLEHDECA